MTTAGPSPSTSPSAGPRPRDPDTFDVVSSVRALADAARYHRLLILVTALICVGLAALYAYVWPPTYQVEATIMAESDTDQARDSFYSSWNWFRKDSARTEIELMTSGSVLKEVIQREHLSYDDVYHPFGSQLSYFWEKSWPGRGYKALKGWVFGADEADEQDPATAELGRTLQDMKSAIQVTPVGESNVGLVRVKGPTKAVAAQANAILKVYLEQRGERHTLEARQAFESLTAESEKARNELNSIAAERVDFLEKHALTFDLQKETQEVKALSDLEASLIVTRTKLANLEGTLAELDRLLVKELPTTRLSSVFELNSVRENAKLKRLEVQSQIALTQARYREDSPEIQELRDTLARLDLLIADNVERVERGSTEGLNVVHQQILTNRNATLADLNGTRASLASMQASAQQLSHSLVKVPAMQSDLRVLDRVYAVAAEKYQALLSKRAQVEVSMATAKAASPSLRVIDYAVPPASKSWPRAKILYPAALGLGLVLGLMAAQIKRLASGRIRRGTWGRRTGDAPIYGSVVVQPGSLPLALLNRRPEFADPAGRA